jgi:hypothetical protein
VLSVLFAITIDSINDIWSWMIMGLTAGLLGPSVLRFYWWRFTGVGFAVGTLGGMLAAVTQRLLAPDMHEFLVFAMVMSAGTAGAVIGSLASKPIDDDILWKFYDRTRPFGFWGPYLNRLERAERKRVVAEHRYDLLATPFALLWQVSMFMVSMLLLLHSWFAAGIWLTLMLAGLAGLYLFWYRQLPAENWFELSSKRTPSKNPASTASPISDHRNIVPS